MVTASTKIFWGLKEVSPLLWGFTEEILELI